MTVWLTKSDNATFRSGAAASSNAGATAPAAIGDEVRFLPVAATQSARAWPCLKVMSWSTSTASRSPEMVTTLPPYFLVVQELVLQRLHTPELRVGRSARHRHPSEPRAAARWFAEVAASGRCRTARDPPARADAAARLRERGGSAGAAPVRRADRHHPPGARARPVRNRRHESGPP